MAPKVKKSKIAKKRKSAKPTETIISSPASGTLFTLPPEIRNEIYKYALHPDSGVCMVTEGTEMPEPALLLTCKAVRNEAIGIFYSETQFHMVSNFYSPAIPTFIHKKNVALSKQYKCEIVNVEASMQGSPKWDGLVAWLRLYYSNPEIKGFATLSDPRDPHEQNFLAGLFKIVDGMWDCPWEAVEDILDLMRHGLTRFDRRWADN